MLIDQCADRSLASAGNSAPTGILKKVGVHLMHGLGSRPAAISATRGTLFPWCYLIFAVGVWPMHA